MLSNEFTSKWIDAGGWDMDLAEEDHLVVFQDIPTGVISFIHDIEVQYDEDSGTHTVFIMGEKQ